MNKAILVFLFASSLAAQVQIGKNVQIGSNAAAGVTSVTNGDGTLTISPTAGAVIAAINLAHINHWTGAQTFDNITVTGTCTGCGGSGSVSGLTAGYIPLAGSATTITANSHIHENTAGQTTLTQKLVISAPGNGMAAVEGTAPSGIASSDVLWPDSTAHRWVMNNNNAGPVKAVGIATAGTSGNCVKLAANGIDVVDNGTACGPGANFITRGLTALYLFREGSGATTAFDTSGANSCSGAPCNITLGGGTDPTMTTLGLNLATVSAVGGGSQVYTTLPAALVPFKSITVGTYVPATANGAFLVPTNWSSSQNSDGSNYWTLLYSPGGWKVMNGSNGKGFGSNEYMQIGGSPVTQIVDSWVGAATHTWVVGTNASTDPDHIYLNNGEGTYVVQGATLGGGTYMTTPFYIGNAVPLYPTYRTGFPGTVTCMAVYSVQLTAAEAVQNDNACNQLAASRGINTIVIPNPTQTNQIACTGDSIFSNIGSTTPVCSSMSGLTNTYTTNANGLPGWTCKEIQTLVPFRESYLFSSYNPRAVGIVECGNNDAQLGTSPANVTNAIISLGKSLHSIGAQRVFLTTLMSSVGYGTSDSTLKDVINPLIRNAAAANGYGLIDYATNANLGADGAGSNTTYFIDGIHPTTTGKGIMAAMMSNAVNEWDGSTLAGGCPNLTVAATYTETAADGCIRANSASNNVAITLVSCAGYSQPRYVKNISTGGNTVTVTPASGEQIDGSGSAVTVANAATLTLYPRAADSTGTCHWERY
jgi:hypothetical protein